MKTLHVCLLSEHLLANLIPVLQERPDAVLALATAGMTDAGLAARFKNLCEEERIKCRVEPFEQAGWSAQLQSAARVKALIEHEYPEWRVRLNLTGGTKTMALSMVLGLRGVPYEPFYCDTERDRIETLHANGTVDTRTLQDTLTVKTYLMARGLKVTKAGTDSADRMRDIQERRSLTLELAKRLPVDPASLSFINEVAASARNPKGKGPEQFRASSIALQSEWALVLLAAHDLIAWSSSDASRIRFKSDSAAKYVSGGWLEEYVDLVLADCAPHESATDLEVLHERGRGVLNQFDGLALHRNRMLFIEAKTANMARDEKEQDVLNKIEVLGGFATGKFGTTLLVSARILPDNALDRARAFGIDVMHGANITRLEEYIRAWMVGEKLGDLSA